MKGCRILLVPVLAALACAPVAGGVRADRAQRDRRPAPGRRTGSRRDHVPLRGSVRTLLAWGAVNARPPSPARPQVAFRLQYGGRSERTRAGPIAGPPLAWLVGACTAADGTHWALQAWQRMLPNYGVPPTGSRSLGAPPLALVGPAARSSRSGPTGRTVASTTSTAASPTARAACSDSARPGSACRSTRTGATSSSTRSAARTGRAGSGRTASSPTSRRAASVTASTPTGRTPWGREEVPRDGDRPWRHARCDVGRARSGRVQRRRRCQANAAQRALLGADPALHDQLGRFRGRASDVDSRSCW